MNIQTHLLRLLPTSAGSTPRSNRSLTLPFVSVLLVFIAAPLAIPGLAAQPLGATQASTFWVDGTSTLHDWTIETHSVGGAINEQDGVIGDVSLSIPVTSLKSGKSAMDDKVYDALDAKKHPSISIKTADVRFAGDTAQVDAEVTVKGMTRTIRLTVTRGETDGAILFTGRAGFRMTDFNVTPPQAMLGAVKAGDEIVVRFELHMTPTLN